MRVPFALLRVACLGVVMSVGVLQGMFPFTDTVYYDATKNLTLHPTQEWVGFATNQEKGCPEVVTCSMSVTTRCKQFNFQSINQTLGSYQERCIPISIETICDKDLGCFVSNFIMITPIVTPLVAGIVSVYRNEKPQFKKLLCAFGASMVYATGCLYAFENYTDRGEQAQHCMEALALGGGALIGFYFGK